MTRINADIPPKKLLDQHLMAEYRELPMVAAALRRSMRTRAVGDILQTIPKKFTLNKGHVSFHYDKMAYLERRFNDLKEELLNRNYNISQERTFGGENIPYVFYKDAEFDKADREVIADRIIEKVAMKPDWYTYYGNPIKFEYYESEMNEYIKGEFK